jgi:hypothetical protein
VPVAAVATPQQTPVPTVAPSPVASTASAQPAATPRTTLNYAAAAQRGASAPSASASSASSASASSASSASAAASSTAASTTQQLPNLSGKLLSDYRVIMAGVQAMQWSGNWGPSVTVQTRLSRNNNDSWLLYYRIRGQLHDQPIPGTSKPRLYYYVGQLCPPLKAGFRISGHKIKSSQIRQGHRPAVYGILHVENRPFRK